MEKLKKVIKDNKLIFDIINVILGIILVILIVLIIMVPTNRILFKTAFYVGGLMNIMNGFKLYKNKARLTVFMSMIILGTIIIFAGAFLI